MLVAAWADGRIVLQEKAFRYPVVGAEARRKGCVSVIIPCFNGERFIAEAIDCALAQEWRDTEVVVVNDGSTDRSADILRGYGERIRVVSQDNRGLPAARNAGIRASVGEYVCFLDADDHVSTDFVREMVSALTTSGAAIAYCGWQNFDQDDCRTDPYRSNDPFVPPDYELGNKIENLLRYASPWPVHGAVVRAEALRETGGFDETLPTCEDYELWLRVAATRRLVRVEKVMAFYRHHGSAQMSSNRWRQAHYVWSIKREFVRNRPELVSSIAKPRLRELIDGSLRTRGYDAYWRRDLVSAQRIFRQLLRVGYWSASDLKYLLPALLPQRAYVRLISHRDRGGRTGRKG